jgi:hypothetical protein
VIELGDQARRRPESHHAASIDRIGFPGPWISSDPRHLRSHAESAETAELHGLTLRENRADLCEGHFDNIFGFVSGEAGAGRVNRFEKICSGRGFL